MSTITRTIHLYAKSDPRGAGVDYWPSGCAVLDVASFGRCIASVDVDFDVPALNPVAMAIEELEAEKAAAADAFRKTMAHINERLQKLQAIENAPTAAVDERDADRLQAETDK